MSTGTTIWTVGHGLAKPELVRSVLDAAHIEVVIDVRSVPYSRRNQPFSRTKLPALLTSWSMEYLWLGENLGGLDTHRSQHLPEACDEVAKLARTKNVALLCSESGWRGCHRDYLLAGEFQARGLDVIHLLHTGEHVSAPALAQRIAEADQQPGLW